MSRSSRIGERLPVGVAVLHAQIAKAVVTGRQLPVQRGEALVRGLRHPRVAHPLGNDMDHRSGAEWRRPRGPQRRSRASVAMASCAAPECRHGAGGA